MHCRTPRASGTGDNTCLQECRLIHPAVMPIPGSVAHRFGLTKLRNATSSLLPFFSLYSPHGRGRDYIGQEDQEAESWEAVLEAAHLSYQILKRESM